MVGGSTTLTISLPIEITAALARDIRVIPVLVDGARIPKGDKLPDRLKSLLRRNAVEVRNTHFGRDAEALVEKVREAIAGGRPVPDQRPSLASTGAWLLAPNQWRRIAASAIALLLVGWFGLYQIGVPVWVPWTRAEQPADAATWRKAQEAEQQRLKEEEQRQAKAAADAEAKRKAAEAEQQQLKEEEQRRAKAAADAEAKRKAAEAEQQRLAATQEEQQRQAKTSDFEAKLKAAEAEQQRLKQEVERQAKAAADAEAKRKAAEAEQQRLKEEVKRQAKAAADAEEKRKTAEIEQQRLAEARPNVISPQVAPTAIETETRSPKLTKADITNLFKPFEVVLERVRNAYVEKPDDVKLLSSAMDAMQRALPSTQRTLTGGRPPQTASNAAVVGSPAKVDVNAIYDAALQILNDHKSDGDDVRLVEVAIKGMLAGLDPHSSYMDAKRYTDMQAQTRGEFGGLGIEVTMQGGLIKVVSPLDDTPAAKAGIMANDIITHIDQEPVQGLTLDEAVAKMRGPVSTKIKLTVMRKGQDIEVSITRDKILVRSVSSRLEGDDVGFIRITQFNEHATDGLKRAITTLFTEAGDRLKGFIIDLRNNPGGLLDQAISVSDAFLEKGEIVSTRGRNAEETQRFNARAGDLTRGKPILVLINGGTAAASEIVAGALQDHRRATVIGTRSFGKGSLQTIIPLGSGNGALRLTTARYFTPSGRSIQAKGITPDIEVLQDVPDDLKMQTSTRSEASLPRHFRADGDEQTGSDSYIPPNPKDDKALHLALDLIRGVMKNSAYPPNPKTAVPNQR